MLIQMRTAGLSFECPRIPPAIATEAPKTNGRRGALPRVWQRHDTHGRDGRWQPGRILIQRGARTEHAARAVCLRQSRSYHDDVDDARARKAWFRAARGSQSRWVYVERRRVAAYRAVQKWDYPLTKSMPLPCSALLCAHDVHITRDFYRRHSSLGAQSKRQCYWEQSAAL